MAISGSGIAHITGFDDTPAVVGSGGSGSNYVFNLSASTTTAVPDGGSA